MGGNISAILQQLANTTEALANTTEAGPEGTTQIRVLIADDHPLIIAGIRRAVERVEDREVVGEAHTGPELVQLVERPRPDAVLMDLRMPGVTDKGS